MKTKEKIIGDSLDLFNENTFELSTTNLLAKRSNILEGSLWYHFNSKQDCIYKWTNNECVEYNYPIMHDKGAVGGLLKGFFGYNGDPSLIEFITWLVSICCLLYLWRNSNKGD